MNKGRGWCEDFLEEEGGVDCEVGLVEVISHTLNFLPLFILDVVAVLRAGAGAIANAVHIRFLTSLPRALPRE